MLNLGRIGHTTRWAPSEIRIRLTNLADVPLFSHVESLWQEGSDADRSSILSTGSPFTSAASPEYFGSSAAASSSDNTRLPPLTWDSPVPLAPLGTRTLTLQLHPSRMAHGKFAIPLAVVNSRNAQDTHVFIVKGRVANCRVQFSRLRVLEDEVVDEPSSSSSRKKSRFAPTANSGGDANEEYVRRLELQLPALIVPTPRNEPPTDEWFTMQNTTQVCGLLIIQFQCFKGEFHSSPLKLECAFLLKRTPTGTLGHLASAGAG